MMARNNKPEGKSNAVSVVSVSKYTLLITSSLSHKYVTIFFFFRVRSRPTANKHQDKAHTCHPVLHFGFHISKRGPYNCLFVRLFRVFLPIWFWLFHSLIPPIHLYSLYPFFIPSLPSTPSMFLHSICFVPISSLCQLSIVLSPVIRTRTNVVYGHYFIRQLCQSLPAGSLKLWNFHVQWAPR